MYILFERVDFLSKQLMHCSSREKYMSRGNNEVIGWQLISLADASISVLMHGDDSRANPSEE